MSKITNVFSKNENSDKKVSKGIFYLITTALTSLAIFVLYKSKKAIKKK
ncbi:MAG: hypothetical protein K6E98_02070 [Lachnospiraceae bacterium]|nr:hypothetical protein [Lachnospiraceae bacterium]